MYGQGQGASKRNGNFPSISYEETSVHFNHRQYIIKIELKPHLVMKLGQKLIKITNDTDMRVAKKLTNNLRQLDVGYCKKTFVCIANQP